MIAIIAGTGNLPIEAARILINSNRNFFIISLFPDDNITKLKKVINGQNEIITEPFYKVGKIFNLLKEKKCSKVLLIGKVDKQNMLKKIKFDWFALKFFTKIATKSDTTLMQGIVDEIENQGMKVLRQSDVLNSLFIPPGILTGKLTAELKKNIYLGLDIAKKLSTIDIGQTVIVKDKMILAVEAIEGTDSCIKRGIELGKKNIIICKTAHDNQNHKFDLPTLGPNTLKKIKKGQVKLIAWHSSKTLISNQKEFIKIAKELNITLISI